LNVEYSYYIVHAMAHTWR